MTGIAISNDQLRALQSLWAAHARRSLEIRAGDARAERLAWAASQLGHSVSSFKDLSEDEASQLIDVLKISVGQQPTAPRPMRARAREMGTAGRHAGSSAVLAMASAQDLDLLRRDLEALSWSDDRLRSFLASPTSPLRGRTQIRTLADVNKVHWALKNILAGAQKRGGDAA